MMISRNPSYPRRAFTLIELLVVIAIIAILAVVVVLVLNPAQLLAQSRDANRMSDMATLASAINLYTTDQSGASSFFLGTSSLVYVSLPDTTSTCANIGLPAGFSCVSSTASRSANGTGWIPIDFKNISSGSPFGSLPLDPVNSSSSGLYYMYESLGTPFEILARMESQKYQNIVSGSLGSGIDVQGPAAGAGPVGSWSLDEGTSTTAFDQSGNGNTGTWYGTPTGTSGYYSPGLNQAWAGTFNATATDYVDVGNAADVQLSNGTMAAWIKTSNAGASSVAGIIAKQNAYAMFLDGNIFSIYDWSGGGWRSSGINLADGKWHFVACSFMSGVTNGTLCYVDGVLSMTTNFTISNQSVNLQIGYANAPGQNFTGLIQDASVYSRVLSPAEIMALYNAEK